MTKYMNKKIFTILIPLIIFLLAFGWRLWGLNSQGETWDEIAYFNAGHEYMKNLKNLDFNADHWIANREHPAVAKYIYGLISIPSYLSGETNYTAGRTASALMGVLTVLIVYLLGRDLFSKRVGILAALILTFTPALVALNKVYGLDSPTILFFTLTIYLFIRALTKNNHSFFILSGISLGLAIGARFNNFLLLVILPIIYLIIKGKNIFARPERKFLWYWLIIPVIAGIVFFISWPWLWSNTLNHWNITVGHWSPVKDIFWGQIVVPGWNYYLVHFAVSTPIVLLILGIIAIYLAFKTRNKYLWVIIVWFASFFLWTLAPTKQNGIRYIVALYPALAIMCASGYFYLVKRAKNIKLVYLGAGVIILYLIIINITIHPYYLDYYNELVGGPKNVAAKKLFPIAWWGEGLKEAVDWVNKNAESGSKIFINSSPDHTGGKLRDDLVKSKEDADYIIINQAAEIYWGAKIDEEKYHEIYQVKAMGAPIIKIYQKK